MIGLDVRSDAKRVIAEISALNRQIVDKATLRAINRALDTAQTVGNRKIRETYNIKARAVRAAMKKRRANARSLFARLEVSGALIPLIEFDARWTRTTKIGASFRVKKGGPRRRIRGAFIGVHGATGARQVFVRRGAERYPIKTLRSLALPQAFLSRAVIGGVDAAVAESFEKNFRQQLVYLGAR